MTYNLLAKLLVLLMLGLALVGCGKAGTPVDAANAKDNFEVMRLFEAGGCTVYRFQDNGRLHYFTNCGETISHYSCGKGCIRDETIGRQ